MARQEWSGALSEQSLLYEIHFNRLKGFVIFVHSVKVSYIKGLICFKISQLIVHRYAIKGAVSLLSLEWGKQVWGRTLLQLSHQCLSKFIALQFT